MTRARQERGRSVAGAWQERDWSVTERCFPIGVCGDSLRNCEFRKSTQSLNPLRNGNSHGLSLLDNDGPHHGSVTRACFFQILMFIVMRQPSVATRSPPPPPKKKKRWRRNRHQTHSAGSPLPNTHQIRMFFMFCFNNNKSSGQRHPFQNNGLMFCPQWNVKSIPLPAASLPKQFRRIPL